MEEITKLLFDSRDEKYAGFQSKLIPTVERGKIIGVRTPVVRKLAKTLMTDAPDTAETFIKELPHEYFDEYQLHAMMISSMKDYERAMDETEVLLPFINNWATCDQLSPKVFARNKQNLLEHIYTWLDTDLVFTVRFAVGMLLRHFLDEDFKAEYPETVAGIRSGEYYINMMVAWYFATALAKQWETAIPYIENRRLDEWIHNKTIQKAIESYRISDEKKNHLRKLKIR